ncbi:hypothetical protein LTS18_011475, partial [Coniosporium uncinatum]
MSSQIQPKDDQERLPGKNGTITPAELGKSEEPASDKHPEVGISAPTDALQKDETDPVEAGAPEAPEGKHNNGEVLKPVTGSSDVAQESERQEDNLSASNAVEREKAAVGEPPSSEK